MFRRTLASAAAALVLVTMAGLPVIAQDASFAPPQATPIAEPPDVPSGDGTGVRLITEKGDIIIGLFTESSPVAAENFLNLTTGGYYDGTTIHRLVPGFVIQGGDPEGTGQGGPGYTIVDEPVVGRYGRGIVAMARTPQPDSQGSQFFIVLDDTAEGALTAAQYGYAIFGRVIEGMDVVDAIAGMPNSGQPDNIALEPVTILTATVEQVTLPPEPIPGDPELEAMMPTDVNGQPFEARSNNGTELQAQIPDGDPFGDEIKAALALLGATIEDLSLGGGSVGTEGDGLSITGLRVRGVDAAAIEEALLPILLGFGDLQRASSTLGGKDVRITTDGPDSDTALRFYVYGTGDTVFLVQGIEPYLTDAITQLP